MDYGIVFIGLPDEAALREVGPLGRFNVDTPTITTGGSHGIETATAYLVISYHDQGAGEVFYLMRRIDQYQTINGQFMEPGEGDKHRQRKESAQLAAEAWLAREQIPYRRALIAVPEGLRLLEGEAEFLLYDKESDRYTLRPSPVEMP